jgi:flagellin
MKLSAALKRTDAQSANVSNALSFLQTAAGSLKTAASVLERMSELGTLGSDVTKNTADISNYETEFSALYAELVKLTSDTFNGVDLFSTTASSLTVYLSEDGQQSMGITQSNLATSFGSLTSLGVVTGTGVSLAESAIQTLATMMATNGAEQSRLDFAIDNLRTKATAFTEARSRISDVDVATEVTRLNRSSVLLQSGASMLTQANVSNELALKLLSA